MDNSVAVAILNWNGYEHLKSFLPSVVSHSKEATIYVIDNASTDESVSLIKSEFPTVQLIINRENGGYAKGYNDGLQSVQEEFVILLNSDVEVTPNWISPVIQLMQSDAQIGIAQPKLLDYTYRTKFEYAGAAGGFIDYLGYPFCQGRLFQDLEEDNGQYNQNRELFWASGACLFIRNSLFKKMGGFDESYFAHMEEIDLCWRSKNVGYKVYYCAKSVVYHLGGGTLSAGNPRKTFLNFRNSLITLKKNDRSGFTYLKLFARLLLDGLAFIKLLIENGWNHAISIPKAHFSFYSSNIVKSEYQNANLTNIYKGSIVIDYFLKGKKKFLQLKKGFS